MFVLIVYPPYFTLKKNTLLGILGEHIPSIFVVKVNITLASKQGMTRAGMPRIVGANIRLPQYQCLCSLVIAFINQF